MALVSHQRCLYNGLNGSNVVVNGTANGDSGGVPPTGSAVKHANNSKLAQPMAMTMNGVSVNSTANGHAAMSHHQNGHVIHHHQQNGVIGGHVTTPSANGMIDSSSSINGMGMGMGPSSSSSTCSSLLAAHHNHSSSSMTSPPASAHPDRPIGFGAFGIVWSVTDPRSGKRVALKKMPNVFQNLASCKRVFREIRILSSFKHDNVLACLDILQPANSHLFQELYVLTELMQSDLHKIIVSPQPLTADHVKVFLYQILRGVKYLHSANIIHRDIKPGNLLVNSNCILKICDFGLARLWDPADQGHLTHEVVTQYYRAPELLMGARRYTVAVDMWSIGCILAELLGRRILFQAQGPIDQLNLIIDLLGTPTISQMKYACDGARCHVLKSAYRPPNAAKLYSLSSQATHDAVHLLTQMLTFDPDQRISIDQALSHSYVEEGRLRFHSCMCTCCYTSSSGTRIFTDDFEPRHKEPFDPKWEKELARYSMYDLRDRIYKFITDRPSLYGVPLCINPHSAAYKSFTNSGVAQASDMPPSPHAWDQ